MVSGFSASTGGAFDRSSRRSFGLLDLQISYRETAPEKKSTLDDVPTPEFMSLVILYAIHFAFAPEVNPCCYLLYVDLSKGDCQKLHKPMAELKFSRVFDELQASGLYIVFIHHRFLTFRLINRHQMCEFCDSCF